MSKDASERYYELFPVTMNDTDIANELNSYENDPDSIKFRKIFCDNLLLELASGYVKYGDYKFLKENKLVNLFIKTTRKMTEEQCFYQMVRCFFEMDYKNCIKYFDLYVDKLAVAKNGVLLTEADLVEDFIEPFKEAFPGFWKHAQEKLSPICEKNGTHDLCNLMDAIHSRESDEAAIDLLTSFIIKYPDIVISREFLGCIYANVKMYRNAIAEFESVDQSMLYYYVPASRDVFLGCLCRLVKDYKASEQYYLDALEKAPECLDAMNDYGYCLYVQKKYVEAKNIFEKCLEEKRDLPYSANNYARTLVALGRNKDAKDFIKRGYKLIPSLVKKIKALPNTNKRISKSTIDVSEAIEDVFETTNTNCSKLAERGTQFSTEKILEDELTARIESGIPAFGLNLKIYKRKGEYGRQYRIDDGRLDLLCEDDKGNLYIIELKKDNGYDDAYEQTIKYLNWFDKNPKFSGKTVYGIICLSNPTEAVIKKVHANERIRLFNYYVSYNEI